MSPVLLVAVAPFAIGLIVWSIVDLERFVLVAVLASVLIPASLGKPGGANVAAVDVLLLIALASWLINNALGNAPDPAFRGRVILAGAIFAVMQWVSLIWSTNLHRTLQFSIQAVELFVIFPVIFASLPRSLKNIERSLKMVVFGTGVLAVVLIVSYFTNAYARKVGVYLAGYNKNAAGGYEAAGVVIAYALMMRRAWTRSWLAAGLLLDAAGLAASASRGSMLGAAAGILVVNVIMKRGRLAVMMVFVLFVALYVAVIVPGEAAKTAQHGSYSSATERLAIWKSAVQQIEKDPFFGIGAGAYYDPLHGQPDPNNTILRTWAELGILGLLALGYLLWCFGRMIPPWRQVEDRDAAALAAATAGTFVCALMHSEVDVSWVRGLGSIMFAALGLMLAVERLAGPLPKASPAAVEVVPSATPVLGRGPVPSRVSADIGV